MLAGAGGNGTAAAEVRAALGRVLASEGFSRSERLQRFLTYIVEKSLEGRPDEIKEYNIGVAVYDREPSFDPRTDTIVRVEARRLRQQLAAYYAATGGAEPLRIEVPKGGYSPAFHRSPAEAPAPLPVAKSAWSAAARGSRKYLAVAALPVVALAGWLLWRNGVYPFQRVPYSWAVERSTLRILDDGDRLCWEVRLPESEPGAEATVRDKVLIADVDDDGRPEVLVNVTPRDIAERGGYLQCYEHNGRLRWTRHYGGRKTFGDRTFEARYVGKFLRLIRVAGRPRLLAVASHHIWYPAVAVLLDPKTGAVEEEYWHPGVIYECLLRDIDGDGADEVLFAAINNPGFGLGHAALGALKVPFSKAPRPDADALREFPPLTGGGELAYVLFPLPDVSRVMGQLPEIIRMSVDGSGQILLLTPIPERGGIVYTLDFRLEVKSHRPSDNFASLHERYRRQNLIDHPLTEREVEALGKVLRFAAAPDGNSPEVERLWR